jgi:ADP-ribose pyrophosphatase YjhB (NUDIX family)
VVNLGERVEDAARREILEETGLFITIEKLIGIVDNIIHDDQGKIQYHYVLIDYLAHSASKGIEAHSDADQVLWSDRQMLSELPVLSTSRKLIEETMGW